MLFHGSPLAHWDFAATISRFILKVFTADVYLKSEQAERVEQAGRES
jgi:hypothetical protein